LEIKEKNMTNANHHDANPSLSGTDGLIPVFNADIGGILQPAVDARELHQFLGVKRDFSTWIKRRLKDYGLVENQDYSQAIDSKAHQNGGAVKSSTYGQDKIDYHLTLDVAKELAMVEKNAKGREARRYFIECERRLNGQQLPLYPHSAEPPPLPGQGVGLAPDGLAVVGLMVRERTLFLALRHCGAQMGGNPVTVNEMHSRWQVSRTFYASMVSDMWAGVGRVVAATEGPQRDKKEAAVSFLGDWYPDL
jgi:phage anti-repressor protein